MYIIKCIPDYFWFCGQHSKWSAFFNDKHVNYMLPGQIILTYWLTLLCFIVCFLVIHSIISLIFHLILSVIFYLSPSSPSPPLTLILTSMFTAELRYHIICNTGSEVIWRTCSSEDIWVTIECQNTFQTVTAQFFAILIVQLKFKLLILPEFNYNSILLWTDVQNCSICTIVHYILVCAYSCAPCTLRCLHGWLKNERKKMNNIQLFHVGHYVTVSRNWLRHWHVHTFIINCFAKEIF